MSRFHDLKERRIGVTTVVLQEKSVKHRHDIYAGGVYLLLVLDREICIFSPIQHDYTSCQDIC